MHSPGELISLPFWYLIDGRACQEPASPLRLGISVDLCALLLLSRAFIIN